MPQSGPPGLEEAHRQVLLSAIAGANSPIKPAELLASAGLAKKIGSRAVHAFLQRDLAQKGVFNWGSEKTPAYWHKGREQEARERVLALAAAEVLDEKAFDTRVAQGVPKLAAAFAKATRSKQLAEGLVVVLTSPPGSRRKAVVSKEHPEPFLALEIARLLAFFGREVAPERICALVSEEPAESVSAVAERLFRAMNRIAFSPGTTVTFYKLRQEPELAQVPKALFDEAALLLQHQRKALLSVHDHAAALPAEERERFVADALGNYYVSIYAR